MAKRNPVFDMMKGIGIILMLMGHMGLPAWTNQFIYSFHMPLFFLLAGYFMPTNCNSQLIDSFVKYFKRLVLPYIVTMLLLVLWSLLIAIVKGNYNMVIRHCLSLLWGSMDGLNTKWGYVDNCPMWFLLALFWGKVIWSQLSKIGDKSVIVAFCISISTVIIHKWVKLVPWSLMQGLSSIVFIAIGWYFNHNSMPKWLKVISLIAWPVAMVFSHMGMASIVYKCYPLDVLGSIGGTISMYYMCVFFASHTIIIPKILCWFGVVSLAILCMHHFIILSDIGNSILIRIPTIENRMWINAIETPLCIALAAIMVHVPILRKIYR